jgi:hypothetical protein
MLGAKQEAEMHIKASLTKDGEIIHEHVFLVEEEGDMGRGMAEAYALFRRDFPHLSLFADGVMVKFGKA